MKSEFDCPKIWGYVGRVGRENRGCCRQDCCFCEKGHEVVVAVSAMSGETNRLINLAQEVNDNPNRRELDVLLSTVFREQVSISLLCMALNKRDIQAKSYTGHQVRILTDNAFGKARIKDIDSKKIFADLKAGFVTVIAGFQGRGNRRRRKYNNPGQGDISL